MILDEVDSMTGTAQNALRRSTKANFIIVMEKYIRAIRFILIGNYASSIIPALQSRCTRFRFGPVPRDAISSRLLGIAELEKINISEAALESILDLAGSRGDLRRAINILQAAHSSLDSPDLILKAEHVYSVTGYPKPEEMAGLYSTLTTCAYTDGLKGTLAFQMLLALSLYISANAISLVDLAKELLNVVTRSQLKCTTKIFVLRELSKLE